MRWLAQDQQAWVVNLRVNKAINACLITTLKTLIKETWTTNIEKDINLNEEFHFTGFFGQYDGTIIVKNKLYKFSFDHKKEYKGVIKIKLQ